MIMEEELLEEISGFLSGYMKSGVVRVDSFFQKMNLNIHNLDQLLTVRFLLKEETLHFAEWLPELLRTIKTTTVRYGEVSFGEVRGGIDWSQTTKERLARNYKDRTILYTNESVRSYDTAGNLILKELLGILYTSLFEKNYIQGFEKSKWFSQWTKLRKNISLAYKKNIYIQRINDQKVSERSLAKVLNHRNAIYREAAGLLLLYRNIMRGVNRKNHIESILRETLIVPDNVDVLYELYWGIQLIKSNTEKSQLYLMDGSGSLVASWEDQEKFYHLYHDSTGSKELSFNVTSDEIAKSNNPYLRQRYNAVLKSQELTKYFFGRSSNDNVWSGRPDLILEVYKKDTDELIQVVIGEVKNTKRTEYAITGLAELIDYMHLVKNRKGEYLLEQNVEVYGILCVDNMMQYGPSRSDRIRIASRGNKATLKLK